MPIHVWNGLGGGGGGSLKVYDNEVLIGEYDAFNFITAADEVSVAQNVVTASTLNVYHPAASLASDWTLNNGVEGSAIVPSEGTQQRFVSNPTAEGNPFITNGWAGALHPVSRSNTLTYAPPGLVRFENNTTTTFTIVITYGGAEILNETTAVITANGAYATPAGTVTITNEQANGPGRMANVSVSIPVGTMLPSGGYFDISITHNNITVNNTFNQVFFHDSQTAESTQAAPVLTLNTPVTYQTSAVHHLTTGTTFDAQLSDIDNYFRESTATIGGEISTATLAFNTFTYNSSVFGTRLWDTNDETHLATATVNVPNVTTCGNANLTSQLMDWSYVDSQVSNNLSVILCTKAASTDYNETFRDEGYRINTDLSAWDSTLFVTDPQAIVACGQLQRHGIDYTTMLPHGVGGRNNPDYLATGGVDQDYLRVFPDGGLARQNGTLIFSGTVTTAGMLLEASLDGAEWWDLTAPYLGGSLTPGFPGMVVSGTFPTIDFTLGTVFTVGQMYLRIRLQNGSTQVITNINLVWT